MVNLRRSSNAEQAEVTETFPRRERGAAEARGDRHHSAAGGSRPPCGRHIDRAATRKHKRLLRILPFVFPCCRPIDAARSAPTGARWVSLLSAWLGPSVSSARNRLRALRHLRER